MGALPKSEPEFAEVEVRGGQTFVRLPQGMHLDAKRFQVIRNGNGLSLQPVPKPLTDEELAIWIADMNAYQRELGDFMPEGRNQPQMPEPEDIFPPGFFDEDKQ